MPVNDDQPAMNQKIFSLGLSTEAVSLYLLCCHLEDTMVEVSLTNIEGLWNGSSEDLEKAVAVLQKRRVLVRPASAPGAGDLYRINAAKDWIE